MNTPNKNKQITEEHISKAQKEVWEWKHKASEELNKIPSHERMTYIRNNTQPYIDAILAKRKNKNEVSKK